MSWDILCGLITLVTFLVAVGGVLVRLTRTLATLEEAVRELKDFITRQSGKNDYFYKELARMDKEIAALEEKMRFARCFDEISL
ncbi:MAG: hypothetical protein IJN63_09530 [Clostridia bacterium]|nr:hypothetical protein [Clostridia bacterium]